jgi:hypothetical protein
MRYRKLAPLACTAFLMMAADTDAAEPKAVVELFTSQGCSSCPPADRLMGELAHESSVLVLSLPVDYWDYLGWKDTLASPRYSARQRGYSHERGDREVYTPQAVVNGSIQVLGSDKSAIARAIAQSSGKAMTVQVSLRSRGDAIDVSLPDADAAPRAEVWACGIARAIAVAIARGENSGRTITYHNVGRRWVKLGDWNGKAAHFTLPIGDINEGADLAAILVQAGTADKPGPMLGAAVTELR